MPKIISIKKGDFNINPRALSLEFNFDIITANLEDGRRLSILITWFERIRKANEKQLKNYQILPNGHHIHWPEID